MLIGLLFQFHSSINIYLDVVSNFLSAFDFTSCRVVFVSSRMQQPQFLQPWVNNMAGQHDVPVKASNLSHITPTFLLLKSPQAINVLNISLSLSLSFSVADGKILLRFSRRLWNRFHFVSLITVITPLIRLIVTPYSLHPHRPPLRMTFHSTFKTCLLHSHIPLITDCWQSTLLPLRTLLTITGTFYSHQCSFSGLHF